MPSSQAPTARLSVVPNDDIAHFEGLVRKTAAMCAPLVEEDYADICQHLRIKVWQALLAFDPAKARQTRDAYVFMCVFNRVKDLKKKLKRHDSYIEDLEAGPREAFEQRYFAHSDEDVYAEVLEGDPLIPSTLDERERRVLLYLYFDFSQAEIAVQMTVSRKDVAAAVQGLREKMADWKPGDPVERAGLVDPSAVAA